MTVRATLDLETLVENIDELTTATLLEAFVAADSAERVGALLVDLLTEEEYRNLEQRVKACIASLAASAMETPETTVCKETDLNYGTYCRARKLWRDNSGGMKLIRQCLGEHFPELRKRKV